MPISIAEHQPPNQVLFVVSGETSMQEMMDLIMALRSGDKRGSVLLFDVSAATVNLSGEELRQLAAYAADQGRKSPIGPVAFISSDPGTFGVSRMYQAYSAAEGRMNVGVFHTLSDAQTWLAGLSR